MTRFYGMLAKYRSKRKYTPSIFWFIYYYVIKLYQISSGLSISRVAGEKSMTYYLASSWPPSLYEVEALHTTPAFRQHRGADNHIIELIQVCVFRHITYTSDLYYYSQQTSSRAFKAIVFKFKNASRCSDAYYIWLPMVQRPFLNSRRQPMHSHASARFRRREWLL